MFCTTNLNNIGIIFTNSDMDISNTNDKTNTIETQTFENCRKNNNEKMKKNWSDKWGGRAHDYIFYFLYLHNYLLQLHTFTFIYLVLLCLVNFLSGYC